MSNDLTVGGISKPANGLTKYEFGCKLGVSYTDEIDEIHKPSALQRNDPPQTFKRKCIASKPENLEVMPKSLSPMPRYLDDHSSPTSTQDVPDDEWSRIFLRIYEMTLD